MKRILPFLIFLLSVVFSYAQTEISAFNATGSAYSVTSLTDYQCAGVNPANLGWTHDDHSMNIGFFEVAASIYSEPLTRKQVYNDLFDNSIMLSDAEKLDAAESFTDARLYGNGAVMFMGFSYQDEDVGGFAFSIRERLVWNSLLNDNVASFLFLGYNDPYFDSIAYDGNEPVGYSTNPQKASVVYKGTNQHFLVYREFNLGYGRRIIKNDDIAWYAGVNLKLLLGYASSQYYQEEGGALTAYSALSPVFDVDYGEPTPSQVEGSGYKKVGNGFGFDIGTTLELYNKAKISIAVNDIASINWNGNVYEGNDTRVWKIESEGIDNYNIFEQGELIVADNHPDDGSQWTGLESKKVKLPMNMRAGASYRFNEMIEAGLDVYIPLGDMVPGAFDAPLFGIGAVADPADWVQLSLGIATGGEMATRMPFGVSFFPIKDSDKTWTVGIATRDLISVVKNNNPTVAASFGFLRFSFGQKKTSTRYLEQ